MSERQAPVEPEGGRAAQRRRTRRAIVDATTKLLAAGGSPTVDEVAAAADVSRRTVYMHFPTFDQLLLDASLGALSALDGGPGVPSPDDDAAARVDALVASMVGTADRTLPLGRQIIRLTVDAPPPARSPSAQSLPAAGPRRGFRRIGWIEDAVAPLRDELDDEQFERLVSGLAMVIGFEGMVVLRDVRGADAKTEEAVMSWAARALVDAIRAESSQGHRGAP